MKLLWVIGAAALLAGCAHNLTLTPQDGVGPMGMGQAPAQLVSHSGGLSISLEGRTYNGRYTLQKDGFIGTGFGTGFSGASTTFATATMFGESASGNGRAYLTAADGSSISCMFTYSSMSGTGLGVCRTSAGKLYDLQIH